MAESFGKKTNGKTRMLRLDVARCKLEGVGGTPSHSKHVIRMVLLDQILFLRVSNDG